VEAAGVAAGVEYGERVEKRMQAEEAEEAMEAALAAEDAKLFPALTPEQLERMESVLPSSVVYVSRQLHDGVRFWMEEGFDLEASAIERFDGGEGGPSVVVYGIGKATPAFKGTFTISKVHNPLTKVVEVHVTFEKQGPSNFVDFGGLDVSFEVGDTGVLRPLPFKDIEHPFQFGKAQTVKTEQGYVAMQKVVLAAEPMDSKRATGERNLALGEYAEEWNAKSAKVMARMVHLNLANPMFYSLLEDILGFATKQLGADPTRIFIHEREDKVYGIGVTEDGENPLTKLETYNEDGTHNWGGGDVLGMALTDALLEVAQNVGGHAGLMSGPNKPRPIVFGASKKVRMHCVCVVVEGYLTMNSSRFRAGGP